MSTSSAVIAQRAAQDGKPAITYRYAGDRGVLVEYGEMEFDLTLNFFVLAVDDALRGRPARRADRDRARLPLDARHATTRRCCSPRRSSSICTPCTTRWTEGRDDPEPARHTCRSRSTTRSRAHAVERYIDTIRARRAERRGRHEHRLHRPLQRLRRPRGAVRGGARDRAVDGVHRLLPRAAVHVPARPARDGVRAQVQPDADVDGRGRGRHRRAVLSRSTRSSRRAATSCSGGRCRSTTSAGRNEVFRDNPLLLRPGDRVRFHRVEEDELLRSFDGRARGPLSLPHRGRAFDVGQ